MEWLDSKACRFDLHPHTRAPSVKVPWEVGRVLTPAEWEDHCKAVETHCRDCDVRLGDYRMQSPDFALLLKPGEWPRLAKLVQKLTQEMLAAEQELISRPDLYRLLGLPTNIRRVMEECNPRCQPKSVARIVRFDFHFTKEGWLFSEANTDRPAGLETYGFTKAIAPYYPGYSILPNPASRYAEAICEASGRNNLVGFVHASPPRYVRQAQFLAREVERRGVRTMLLLPRRLLWISNFARIRGPSVTCTPDLLVRRLSTDELVRSSQHAVWNPWFCGGKTLMSNSGAVVVTASKRFPVVWRELDTRLSAWHSCSPETRCPSELSGGSVTDWVFKPTFGGAGARVAIAGITKQRTFKEIVDQARRHPARWVAQRRFESVALPTERGPGHVCLGIYTVDGVAAGVFTRIRGQALIDHHSLMIPLLIPQSDAKA
jgi:hypothetical protein